MDHQHSIRKRYFDAGVTALWIPCCVAIWIGILWFFDLSLAETGSGLVVMCLVPFSLIFFLMGFFDAWKTFRNDRKTRNEKTRA
jgi:hypothetical protein